MKSNMAYDQDRPLLRLETGDKAIIKVFCPVGPKNNRHKFKDTLASGTYEAIVVSKYVLECKEEPLLSGRYCYWNGNKWGCSGIYADELTKGEKV